LLISSNVKPSFVFYLIFYTVACKAPLLRYGRVTVPYKLSQLLLLLLLLLLDCNNVTSSGRPVEISWQTLCGSRAGQH